MEKTIGGITFEVTEIAFEYDVTQDEDWEEMEEYADWRQSALPVTGRKKTLDKS